VCTCSGILIRRYETKIWLYMRIGINAIYLIIYININAYGYNVFHHMNMDIFNEYVYIYIYVHTVYMYFVRTLLLWDAWPFRIPKYLPYIRSGYM
jgi:membrane protein YdbS with pleckstrin-like domain